MSEQDEIKQFINGYIGFQSISPSPFHVVAAVEAKLRENDFSPLEPHQEWKLNEGKGYFVVHRDRKSIVAFKLGQRAPAEAGFAILGAHTDSPVLRLRLNPFDHSFNYNRLLTQTHGSLIFRSWLDRPLLLAGMVYSIRRQKGAVVKDTLSHQPLVEERLCQSLHPIGVIPDLAIHLDRQKNKEGAINAEHALQVIFGVHDELEAMKKILLSKIGASDPAEVDGFELTLAPYWPHLVVGVDQSMILGPRHDDLAMVYAGLRGFLRANEAKKLPRTAVAAFFDAEETGSSTSSGAKSFFLRDVLSRVNGILSPNDPQATGRSLASSLAISADMAHAVHPSYAQKHDTHHQPLLNRGLVLKENADDCYATSGFTGTYFKALCEAAKVPLQQFIARQDGGCGSTIGPFVAANLSCPVVDMGTPMWGMHSAAETMGTKDLYDAHKVFELFFTGLE